MEYETQASNVTVNFLLNLKQKFLIFLLIKINKKLLFLILIIILQSRSTALATPKSTSVKMAFV